MNRSIKTLFVLLFLILPVSGAFAAEKKNKPETKLMDNYIAVFDFKVNTGDKDISLPLTESVRREIILSGKYKVIDRGNMEKILGEHKLRMSGCVTGECIVETGQLLGVGKLIGGTVSMVGKTYYLTLSLISVKTGEIENIAEDTCKCEVDELLGSSKRLAKRLLGEKVEQPVARAPEPVVAVKPAGPEPRINNSIGMAFVYIKPGTFMMGSPASETGRDNDETQHQVTLTKGFYMGETEITVGQWRMFARDSGYRTEAETGGGAYTWIEGKWEKKEGTYWDNPGFAQSEKHPVTCVSWNDAQAFIRWINRKEGVDYRLPTEAEWEYAARAGSTTAFANGGITEIACGNDPNLNAMGWYCGNSDKKTHAVAGKQANAWGLYDMHGNVWEWCQDWKGDYPIGSVTDPTGPLSGSLRVFRGGSWHVIARRCRSAYRDVNTPDGRYGNLGFRLSRTP